MTNLAAAQYKTTCKEMQLKGNVKSISESQYKLNEVNPGLNEIVLTDFSFNKNCRKTKEISNEVGGDIKYRHEISYNKAGKISSEIRQNSDVEADFIYKYKYDASNRLSTKELFSRGRLISTNHYTYNSNGNVAVMEIKKKLGLLDINNEKFEYKYDDKNRLIEEIHNDGAEYRKTEYVYDERDRLTRKVEYNHRGGIDYEFDYEYDEFDNPSVERAKYRGNELTYFSYVYEYDDQKNWINKRSLSNEQTYSLQIRIITYY
jgi:YD repeat-containing protein